MERARDVLIDGVAQAIAGLHRQEKAIRDRVAATNGTPSAGEPPAPVKGGESAPAGTGGEAPRVHVDDNQPLGELLFDLVRLELRVIDQLTTAALRNADRVVTFLQRSGEPRPPAPEPEPVRLAGRRGTSTRTRFVVDNPSLRDAELRLRVSDFAPEAGGAPFPAEVALRPETARLAPRQEIEIEVEIRVDDRFEPGRRYRAEIEVLAAGRPGRALAIALDVEGAVTTAGAAPPKVDPGEPAKPAPRKRTRRKKA